MFSNPYIQEQLFVKLKEPKPKYNNAHLMHEQERLSQALFPLENQILHQMNTERKSADMNPRVRIPLTLSNQASYVRELDNQSKSNIPVISSNCPSKDSMDLNSRGSFENSREMHLPLYAPSSKDFDSILSHR